jgi:4'-phosphopantetheinyl transferase
VALLYPKSALESLEPVEWLGSASVDSIGRLAKNECHVWRIDLGEVLSSAKPLQAMLSDDERARANRFRFAQDKLRYIAGRSALRMILANYLDVPPSRVEFRYGPNGKPELRGPLENQLWFNLTNSGDLVLAAISNGRQTGIDVEKLASTVKVDYIAAQFFTENELSSIVAVPIKCRPGLFFEFWTRKEAFVKALGDGLSIPLDQFDVTGWRDGFLFQAKGFEGDWFVRSFVPEPGYVAALVVEKYTERIQWLQFLAPSPRYKF